MISCPPWSQVAPDLEPDGSLRDLYVLDTSAADWQRTLDFLRATYAPLEFTRGLEAADLPERVTDIFAMGESDQRPMLSFRIGDIQTTCHFFAPEEIEFSIDPAQVPGERELAEVARFLLELAQATGKPALLTPENAPALPILRAEVGSERVVWVPPAA